MANLKLKKKEDSKNEQLKKESSDKVKFNMSFLLYFLSFAVILLNMFFFKTYSYCVFLLLLFSFLFFIVKNDDFKKIFSFLFAFVSFPGFLYIFLFAILPGFVVLSFLFEQLEFLHRFLFSITVSFIFLVVLQALGYLLVPFSVIVLLLLYVVAILIVISFKIKKISAISFKTESSKIFLFSLIFLLCNSFFLHTLFNSNNVPLSQGTAYFVDSYFAKQQFEGGTFVYWDHLRDLGKPMITLDPSAFYVLNGLIMHVSMSENDILIYNALFDFYLLFLALSVFLFLFFIFNDFLIPFLSAVSLLLLPSFTNMINMGATKLLSITPFIFLSLLALCLAQKEKKYYYLLTLSVLSGIFAHMGSGLFIIPAVVAIFFICMKSYNFFFEKKSIITLPEFKTLVICGLFFIGIISFYLFPAFLYGEYTASFSKPVLFSENIKSFYSHIESVLFGFSKENYSSMAVYLIKTLIVLSLAFAVYSAFFLKKHKEFLFYYLSFFITGVSFMLLNSYYRFAQIEVPLKYIIISFVFVLPLLFIPFYFIKDKKIRAIISVIVMLVLVFSCYSTLKGNMSSYLQESLVSGQSFSKEMDFLKSIPQGRVAQYGIFPIAIHPAISYFTNQAAAFGNFYFISNKYNFGDKLLNMSTRLPSYREPYYNDKLLKMAGINYVWFFLCPAGSSGYYSLMSFNYSFYRPIYGDNQCSYVFEIPGSYLADVISSSDYDSYFGKTTYFVNESGLLDPNSPYRPVLSIQKVSDRKFVLSGPFFDNDFLLFKESFMPSVSAYKDKISSSNKLEVSQEKTTGFMLVKTKDADQIILTFEPTLIEKICSVLIVLSIFLLFLFLTYFKKY